MADNDPWVAWTAPVMRWVSNVSGSARSLYGLLRLLEEAELSVPEWQRDRCWTLEQKINWCGFVLSGYPLPAIWIREGRDPKTERFQDEIVDGQQRLTALLAWTRKEVPARLWDGREVWCEGKLERRMLERRTMPCLTLPEHTTDEQVIELYLSINSRGTPHTEADFNRARDWLKNRGEK